MSFNSITSEQFFRDNLYRQIQEAKNQCSNEPYPELLVALTNTSIEILCQSFGTLVPSFTVEEPQIFGYPLVKVNLTKTEGVYRKIK